MKLPELSRFGERSVSKDQSWVLHRVGLGQQLTQMTVLHITVRSDQVSLVQASEVRCLAGSYCGVSHNTYKIQTLLLYYY